MLSWLEGIDVKYNLSIPVLTQSVGWTIQAWLNRWTVMKYSPLLHSISASLDLRSFSYYARGDNGRPQGCYIPSLFLGFSMAIHGHPWPMMAVWDSHGVMVFPGIPTHRVPPASAATPKTYFAPPGQWTSDLANAQTYPNMTTFIWAPGLRALSFSTRSLLCPVWMSNSYLLLLNAAKHYLHIYIYHIRHVLS